MLFRSCVQTAEVICYNEQAVVKPREDLLPPDVADELASTKIKGMVAAEVSDERSAYMTRGHNNSRMITMGAEIVGEGLAKNIAKGFVNGKYDGGRY